MSYCKFAIAVLVLLSATVAQGQEIFADGFELGDTQEWDESYERRDILILPMLHWYCDPDCYRIAVEWKELDNDTIHNGQIACGGTLPEACFHLLLINVIYRVTVNDENLIGNWFTVLEIKGEQ